MSCEECGRQGGGHCMGCPAEVCGGAIERAVAAERARILCEWDEMAMNDDSPLFTWGPSLLDAFVRDIVGIEDRAVAALGGDEKEMEA